MVYRNGPGLVSLILAFEELWREFPADWIIREFQSRTGALIRAAAPSLVKHVGTVSTLGQKNEGPALAKISSCETLKFVA